MNTPSRYVKQTAPSGSRARLARCLRLSGALFIAAGTTVSHAAVNEDEWYDPSDWFDGNNIEYDDTYDYDPYDYTYTNGYDYGYDWDYWDDYYDAYDWDDYNGYSAWDGYSSSYWDRYDWDDTLNDDEPVEGTVYSYSIWVPDRDQQAQNTSASNQASGQGGKQAKQDGKQISRMQGTIEGVKTVKLNRSSGATGSFTLAKVKLENGQSTVVNLGRQSQLRDVNVKKGDKIQAIGRRGQIEGQAVFVAQKLRVNGKDIQANPAIRLKGAGKSGSQTVQSGSQRSGSQTSAAKQQMSDSEDEISGKVANIEKLKESGKNPDRTLVTLTLENGKSETVDLGPGAAPEKIGLDEGDSVTVRGRRDQIQGRDVIVAELVKVNGNRMNPAGSGS